MFKPNTSEALAVDTIENESNPFTTTIPKLENISDKYRFISTQEFIKDVESFGYKLENTTSPRRGLGMHSMSFSHAALPQADGLNMRLLATNSHDATSAFRLHVQVLVQVCSNGLVAWQRDAASDSRVVHRGYAVDKVKQAIDKVNVRFESTLQVIQSMQAVDVSPEAAAEFLRRASELRDAKPIRILDLQRVVFAPQTANTAWNVFNRVQYSLIRGGYRTIETLPDGRLIPGRKARELTAVKERVQTNTKLWELAVETLLNKA